LSKVEGDGLDGRIGGLLLSRKLFVLVTVNTTQSEVESTLRQPGYAGEEGVRTAVGKRANKFI
jgi:hypothetical protein